MEPTTNEPGWREILDSGDMMTAVVLGIAITLTVAGPILMPERSDYCLVMGGLLCSALSYLVYRRGARRNAVTKKLVDAATERAEKAEIQVQSVLRTSPSRSVVIQEWASEMATGLREIAVWPTSVRWVGPRGGAGHLVVEFSMATPNPLGALLATARPGFAPTLRLFKGTGPKDLELTEAGVTLSVLGCGLPTAFRAQLHDVSLETLGATDATKAFHAMFSVGVQHHTALQFTAWVEVDHGPG